MVIRRFIIEAAAGVLIAVLPISAGPVLGQDYVQTQPAGQAEAMHARLQNILQSSSPITGYLRTGKGATNFSLRFANYDESSGTFQAEVGGQLVKNCAASWRQLSNDNNVSTASGELTQGGGLSLALSNATALTMTFPSANPAQNKLSGTYRLFCPGVSQKLQGSGWSSSGQAFLNLSTGTERHGRPPGGSN